MAGGGRRGHHTSDNKALIADLRFLAVNMDRRFRSDTIDSLERAAAALERADTDAQQLAVRLAAAEQREKRAGADYRILADVVEARLGGFIRDDDIAEVAIYAEAIESATDACLRLATHVLDCGEHELTCSLAYLPGDQWSEECSCGYSDLCEIANAAIDAARAAAGDHPHNPEGTAA